MITRSILNWKSLPGNFDKLHATCLYDGVEPYGMPMVAPQNDWEPDWMVPYGARLRTDEPIPNGAIHFFQDDYRFEVVWSRPWDTLSVVQRYGAVVGPDFSVYTDMPVAMQIWNIYRNRWMAAFWQDHGIKVIPNVAWAEPDSYRFCFDGLPIGSTVAVSATGIRDAGTRELYRLGYLTMLERVNPSKILVYGSSLPKGLEYLENLRPVRYYPSRWDGVHMLRKRLRAEGLGRDEAQHLAAQSVAAIKGPIPDEVTDSIIESVRNQPRDEE